jgi:hypothetical protein
MSTIRNIDSVRYKQIESLLGQQKLSPMQQLFGSYLVNQTTCSRCNKQSFTFDLTYHLLISLEK